jgi:hypothetical protein
MPRMLVIYKKSPWIVILANAGIHISLQPLDSRLRGNDEKENM